MQDIGVMQVLPQHLCSICVLHLNQYRDACLSWLRVLLMSVLESTWTLRFSIGITLHSNMFSRISSLSLRGFRTNNSEEKLKKEAKL